MVLFSLVVVEDVLYVGGAIDQLATFYYKVRGKLVNMVLLGKLSVLVIVISEHIKLPILLDLPYNRLILVTIVAPLSGPTD